MPYEKYYSSSDCTVFIESPYGLSEPVLLDKLKTVAYSESLSSQPVYGIGESRYGFLSQGNLIVNGILELNWTHPNYLFIALRYIATGGSSALIGKDISEASISEVLNLTNTQFQEASNTGLIFPPKDLGFTDFSGKGGSFSGGGASGSWDESRSASSIPAQATKSKFDTSIKDYPSNFNLRIILNNSYLHHEDEDKIILIKGIKIVGTQLPISSSSDDPLGDTYTFIAREIARETI